MSEQTDPSPVKAEQNTSGLERRIALVVGVDEAPYSDKESLKHAVDDAKAMAEVLKQHCDFQLLVEPLLNEQATSADVKRAILNLKRDRNDTDFLLFYFSGHGLAWNLDRSGDD